MQQINFSGKTFINEGEDFKLGTVENIFLKDNMELILKEGKSEGSYISPVVNTKNFKGLIVSWNTLTPKDTEIEVLIKVKKDEIWSNWLSYGIWSVEGIRKSRKGQRDRIAKLDIDTLTVEGEKGANAFRYKVYLRRKNINVESPRIRLISVALNLLKSDDVTIGLKDNYLIDTDVPKRSQMVVEEIGNRICSPTSLAMVMEYYGYKIDTKDVAWKVFDSEANIFGNWSFNVAYAGEMGFRAYVDNFCSIDELKHKIATKIPVIVSVRTNSKNELEGAPMAYPNGHLIIIRGFKVKNGEEYVVVNDPAAEDAYSVGREYKLSQFNRAWNRVGYIINRRGIYDK